MSTPASSSSPRVPVMPTADISVRSLLRAAGEPVNIFGETALHRRARLEALWRLQGASLPPTVIEALKIIASCGNAAVDFRGRKLGGSSSAATDGAPEGASSRSIKIADTLSKAPQAVVDFRRGLVDSTLDRAKGRMMLLKQEYLTQRPLIVLTKGTTKTTTDEADSSIVAASFLRTTPLLHTKGDKSLTTASGGSNSYNTDTRSINADNTKGEEELEPIGASVVPVAAVSDVCRLVVKQEVGMYVHTATLKAPPTISTGGQYLRSSVTVMAVVPQAVVQSLLLPVNSKVSTVVATGHEDGRVWLWDIATLSVLNNTPPTTPFHDDSDNGKAPPPGCALAGVPADGEVVPFRNRVTSISFHPLHPLLLLTRRLNDVEVYSLHKVAVEGSSDVKKGGCGGVIRGDLVGLMQKHLGVVHRARVDPTGSFAITTSEDMTIGVWDVRDAAKAAAGIAPEEEEGDNNEPTKRGVPRLLYLQDGHDAASKRNSVFEISFHPDGSLFTTTDFAGFALTWDSRTGRKVFQGGIPHTGRCTAVDWAPSGQQYATGGDDGLIHIYDVAAALKDAATDNSSPYSKKEKASHQPAVLRSICAHRDTVTALEFERTSTHLPVYGQRVTGSQGPEGLRTNVFSRWLLTASVDGAVKVWCTGSGALLRLLHGSGAAPSRYGLGGGSSVAARVALHVPSYDPAQGSHRTASCKALVDTLKASLLPSTTATSTISSLPASCLRDVDYLPTIVSCDHGHGWKLWQPTNDAFAVHKAVNLEAPSSGNGLAEVESLDVPKVPIVATGGSDSDEDEMAALRNKKRRVETAVAPTTASPATTTSMPVAASAPPVVPVAAESDSDDEMAALKRKKGKK